MKPTNTQTNVPVYASESSYQTPAPTTQEQNEGVVPLDTLPASWWNALWQATAKNNNASKAAVDDLREEVISVLTDAGITLSEASTTQLLTAIKTITQRYATALIPGAVVSSSDIKQVSVSPTDGTMTVNAMNDWVGTGTIEQRMTAQDDKIESAIEGQDSKIESAIEGQDSKIEQRMTAQDDKIESAIEGQDDAIEKALAKIDSEVTKYSRIFTGTLTLNGSELEASIDLPAGTTLQKGDTIQFVLSTGIDFSPDFGSVTVGGIRFAWRPTGGDYVRVGTGEIVTGIVASSTSGSLQVGYFGRATTTPRFDGVASAGSATAGYAAGDHVHPTQIEDIAETTGNSPSLLYYRDDAGDPIVYDETVWFRNIVIPRQTIRASMPHRATYLIPFLYSSTRGSERVKTPYTTRCSGAMNAMLNPGTRVNLYLAHTNAVAKPYLQVGFGKWSTAIEIRLPGHVIITTATATLLHNYNELVYDGTYWILLNSTAPNQVRTTRLYGSAIWDWVADQYTDGNNYVIPATGKTIGKTIGPVVFISDSIASDGFLELYCANILAVSTGEPAYVTQIYYSREAIPNNTYVDVDIDVYV